MALSIPPEGKDKLPAGVNETPQECTIVNFSQLLTAIRATAALEHNSKLASLLTVLKNTGPKAYNEPTLIADYLIDHTPELNLDKELITQFKTPAELRLYLTLATNENFGSWQERLKEAQNTIGAVNNSNEGLNLKTDYDLLTIIKALAATNPEKPELTFQAVERMKEPRLVIVPAGLTLNHLKKQLTINGNVPSINNRYYAPDTKCTDATVYIIESGDLKDMQTQPEAVQKAADADGYNTLTDQELREASDAAGLQSNEHVYGMLGVMLKEEDPSLCLDRNTYSVLSNRFTCKQIIAYAYFYYSYCFVAARYHGPCKIARVCPAVMAEI